MLCRNATGLLQNEGIRNTATCTSVVLRRYGPPERLEVDTNYLIPEPSANEVLVQVKAVAVNPLDMRMREGYAKSLFEPLLPLILGRDVSGVVVRTGKCARSRFQEGQEVFGALHPTAVRGTYSQYALLEGSQLALKPPSVSHVDAAAVPFASLTAWRALADTAKVKKGQRVLVMGGGGAVGLAAIQLAGSLGCHVATSCGDSSMEKVRQAGAMQAVHYASPKLKEELEGQFDAVLDTVGMPETEADGVQLLAPGGTYMTLQGELVSYSDRYGLAVGGALAAARLAEKQYQYRQSHNINYWWTVMRTDEEGLRYIANLVSEGRLKIPVGKVLTLDEVSEAHRLRERRLVRGKVVLEPTIIDE